MDKLAVCRICLANDIPMRSIEKCLQEIYEVLTKLPFVTDDRRPMLVCYICCARLQNSYELAKSCVRSEELFQQILSTDASLSLPLEHFPSSRRFGITRAVRIDYCPEIQHNEETCVEGHRSMLLEVDGQVKQEIIEDIKIETSEEMDIKSEEYNQYDDTNDTMFTEEPTLHSENKTIYEIEADVTSCVKTEPRDEQEDFDDMIRWSGTEHEYLSVHKPSRDIPLHSTTNTLQTCGYFIDKEMKTTAAHSENIEDKSIKHEKSDQSDDAEGSSFAQSGVTALIVEVKPSTSASAHSDAFKTKDSSEKHTRKASKRPHQCDFCNKKFERKTNLVKHIRIHTGEKPFECNICKKHFNEKCGLVVHARTHNGEKPFECDVCKKSFKQKVHLLSHHRIHTGEKPFQCDVCTKFFSHKNALVKHRKIHTRTTIRYQCDVCERRFPNQNRLEIHARIHTAEIYFQCDLCKKLFAKKSHLRNHIRIHTGIKQYECDFCKKSFNQKHNLLKHSLTHTGNKPFECDVCKKRFTAKANLNKHKQSENILKCDLCDEIFCNRLDLALHARTHSGFECDVCKKFYASKRSLYAHARSHTKAFECDVCKKCFSSAYKLAKHRRTHTAKKL